MFEKVKAKVNSRTTTYTNQQVISFINECQREVAEESENIITVGKVYKPKVIKRYDLLYVVNGSVPHPCVVFKIRDNNVYCLGITSTESKNVIKDIKYSRFFEKHYFYNIITTISLSEAMKGFVGVFDSKKEVDETVKLLKEYYSKIL